MPNSVSLETRLDQLESEITEPHPELNKQRTRLDAPHFTGLRNEIESENLSKAIEPTLMILAVVWGQRFVSAAIMLNAIQMGASIQFKGEPRALWTVAEHIFTFVFTTEMVLKLYSLRCEYFKDYWNCLDGFVTSISVLSVWILAPLNLDLSSLQALRLFRLMRLLRILHVNPEVKVLAEGLVASVRSLGWILALLFLISYIFAIICCQLVDFELYKGNEEFDPAVYFGDIPSAMLTLFEICILAEWAEIIRPISVEQPFLVVLVFIPYLTLCTFGVLNLIIGVITDRTLANNFELQEEKELGGLREKMKSIIHMTDEIYENDDDGKLSEEEFMRAALAHPDFVSTMRRCQFPRGFDVKDLHCIFDDTATGTVRKDEFINGMFRLTFNNATQNQMTLLLGLAQMKHEMHDKVENELHKIHEIIQERLPVMHFPQGLEGAAADPSNAKQWQDMPMEADIRAMMASIEERMRKFAATFEKNAPETPQFAPTAASPREVEGHPGASPRAAPGVRAAAPGAGHGEASKTQPEALVDGPVAQDPPEPSFLL